MSFAPALAPARGPVTSAFEPLVVASSCLGPLESVACGLPRSHAPVVAVSVAFGLVCQPRLVSKLSWKTTVPPPPRQEAGMSKPFVGAVLAAPPLTALVPRPYAANASQIGHTSSPP